MEQPDEDRHQRLEQILRKEFDVEILHKWREVRIIEEELDKGIQLKALLEKLLLNEQIYTHNMERSSSFAAISQPVSRLSTPAPPGSGISSVYGSGPDVSPRRTRHSSNAQIGSGSSNEPGFLYELCPDGSVVKLHCPVCGAERFRSVLGLVNHCRINCGLIVSNPEDRLQKCGVPVAASEIPPDFLSGRSVGLLRRDRDLAAIRAGVQGPILDTSRRPLIREFSENGEDVDFSLTENDPTYQQAFLGSISGSSVDAEALQSRFYFRKRIVIGNYARSLEAPGAVLDEAEAAARQVATHEWRIFVRPFDPHDDLATYIKAVRFQLHPSYAPNDQITVDRRPFELSMMGWGEFPARIQIIFVDGQRNSPVEFVHFLRLRPCPPRGASQLMSEQIYDLDIDRRSGRTPSQQRDIVLTVGPKQTGHPLDDALAMASRLFPLFGALPKQSPPSAASYNRAVSYTEYVKLPLFDQQALEKERALALQRHLLPAHPGLSLDYVIEWCRRSGLTPLPMPNDQNESSEETATNLSISAEDLENMLFCRYCGLAHFPQDRFDVLQKNCSMRPRKLHLSSRSTASDLVSSLTLNQEASPPDTKRRPVEMVEDNPPLLNSVPVNSWPVDAQWTHQAFSSLELTEYPPEMETCVALARACRSFLSDLMNRALSKLPDTIERAVGRPALLTPLHLYQVITGITPVSASAPIIPKDKQQPQGEESAQTEPHVPNKFDFLSNAFMAGT